LTCRGLSLTGRRPSSSRVAPSSTCVGLSSARRGPSSTRRPSSDGAAPSPPGEARRAAGRIAGWYRGVVSRLSPPRRKMDARSQGSGERTSDLLEAG